MQVPFYKTSLMSCTPQPLLSLDITSNLAGADFLQRNRVCQPTLFKPAACTHVSQKCAKKFRAHLRIVAAAHGLCRFGKVLGVKVDDGMASAEVADNTREGHCRRSSARDDDTCAIRPSGRPLHMQACHAQLTVREFTASSSCRHGYKSTGTHSKDAEVKAKL